jgi:hypothetical protein
MLIEKKFIYLSLPRCASTSFLITCLRNDIKFEHHSDFYNNKMASTIDLNLDNEKLADQLLHGHEKIVDLKRKFGNELPVVGIKRDRYHRFLSLWKHLVDLTQTLTTLYDPQVSKILSTLDVESVLFFKTEDLIPEHKFNLVDEFIELSNISPYIGSQNYHHFSAIIHITINPLSYFHNNDPNIIWFNYENLKEFESWVSTKIERPFILEKSNSSKVFQTKLEINPNFRDKYDEIYNYFDLPKVKQSLI